ncbi:kirola [Beta vulgaris subsp. vulgaris]|uniref:kirola n=1 Tax=Beta vulgaris subsp. vulgaris TaxID=3555 RepID=UPI00254802A8|nr:kirola [Beta vulgaris subsp. vulgaris]
MAKLHRVEGQIELKCEADKYFDVWAHKMYLIQNMCPDKVQKPVLLEGAWNKVGALVSGNYVINEIGEKATLKARMNEIDEKGMSVRYSYHDGFIMEKYYKSLTSKVQAIPKGKGCIVKWSFEYEKMKEDAPDANVYVDFMLAMSKDMCAYLCKA